MELNILRSQKKYIISDAQGQQAMIAEKRKKWPPWYRHYHPSTWTPLGYIVAIFVAICIPPLFLFLLAVYILGKKAESGGVLVFTVQSPDGSSLGEVKGLDFLGRKWKILGLSEENEAIISLTIQPYKGICSGEIETSLSLFKVEAPVRRVPKDQESGHYEITGFQVTDTGGHVCFTVTWIDHDANPNLGREYRIEGQDVLSPFLTFTIAVCLIDRILTRYMSYDYSYRQ